MFNLFNPPLLLIHLSTRIQIHLLQRSQTRLNKLLVALTSPSLLFHQLSHHSHAPHPLTLNFQRTNIETDKLINVKKSKVSIGVCISGSFSLPKYLSSGISGRKSDIFIPGHILSIGLTIIPLHIAILLVITSGVVG